MADSKITALTALTAADPVNDMFPVVDVSDTTMAASGTTKKISVNNILGASGTATLASATITGDLTVDTSTLKVDSTNNRVIVGHTSGSAAFQVTNAGAAGLEIQPTGFSSSPLIQSYNRSGSAYTQLTLDASTIVHALSGTTAMTLNSTGLGVGVTPSAKLHSKAGAVTLGGIIETGGASSLLSFADVGTSSYTRVQIGSIGNTLVGMINGVQAMTLDASGSLLIGTTSATVGATAARLHLSADGTDRWAVGPQSNSQHFIIQASNIYGVYLASLTATSWSSASDERLKDVIEPISNAVAKVGSLRAVIGKFKSDKTNTRKPFLMAQDVLAVLPEAVDVSKPDQFGLAYTDVIPLLVAAIKELSAEVNALKNA